MIHLMVWPTVAEVLVQMRRQHRQAVWPEGLSRNWYSVMVLSVGLFQFSAMDRSPPTPASPDGAAGADPGGEAAAAVDGAAGADPGGEAAAAVDGAAGADPGGEAAAAVVAAASPAAPAPRALAARIWNR